MTNQFSINTRRCEDRAVSIMKFVISICICLFIALALTQVVSAQPKKPQSDSARSDVKFDPCRPTSKLSPAVKKRLKKRSVAVLSACGLNIVPLISKENWGSASKIMMFLPRFRTLLCILLRTVYGIYSGSNGRLEPKHAKNASEIYAYEIHLATVSLRDPSESPDMCIPVTGVNGTTKSCYPKSQILGIVRHILPCLGGALGTTLPENVDAAIYAATNMLAICETNGFINYLAQSSSSTSMH